MKRNHYLRSTECRYCCSSCPSTGSSTGPSSSIAFMGLAEKPSLSAFAQARGGGGQGKGAEGASRSLPAQGPAAGATRTTEINGESEGLNARALPRPNSRKLNSAASLNTEKAVRQLFPSLRDSEESADAGGGGAGAGPLPRTKAGGRRWRPAASALPGHAGDACYGAGGTRLPPAAGEPGREGVGGGLGWPRSGDPRAPQMSGMFSAPDQPLNAPGAGRREAAGRLCGGGCAGGAGQSRSRRGGGRRRRRRQGGGRGGGGGGGKQGQPGEQRGLLWTRVKSRARATFWVGLLSRRTELNPSV